ncbi:hypothetical protein [Oricola thermophila]|uniref:Uncharacterized protein n=1 Tax=Oricola thermophila TaxID=2742145 RepID=A0A6N1VA26_9HYPH|nr:hypothetical protein [Oricola thermophila]QKV17851.1 hypothetical protein HTY61_04945 [Oricola thermophila]
MTFNYAKTRDTADRLIARFGQVAKLIVLDATGGDPWNPTVTETETEVTVAVFDFANSEVDGTLIQQGDKRVYLASDGGRVTPDTSNKLEIGGVRHEIVRVSPTSPGGLDVFYEIQARR